MTAPTPLGYWLKLVDQLIDQQFAATLDEHGVTRRQWQLLNVLSQGDSTLAELDAAVAPFLNPDAHGTGVGESSEEHLAELVESAWVVRAESGYSLTEQGYGAFTRLAAVVAEAREGLVAGVEPAEYDTTIAVLERMARNLGWSE